MFEIVFRTSDCFSVSFILTFQNLVTDGFNRGSGLIPTTLPYQKFTDWVQVNSCTVIILTG